MTVNRSRCIDRVLLSGFFRMTVIGVIAAAFMILRPMTALAHPKGLLEKNRTRLEMYMEALWLSEWDYENKVKCIITPETLTPERLEEYYAPLAKHYGWGRMTGGSYIQVWRKADLKCLLKEALDVTEEQSEAAFPNRGRESVQWAEEYYGIPLEDDEYLFGEGDWGMEYPMPTIERITDLGDGKYQIDGRIDYVMDGEGVIETYPFTSVFRENQSSRFGELTLVRMEIN